MPGILPRMSIDEALDVSGVILTKMDRVPKSRRAKAVEVAARELGLDQEQLLPFSSKTGEGREDLLTALEELLPSPEPS